MRVVIYFKFSPLSLHGKGVWFYIFFYISFKDFNFFIYFFFITIILLCLNLEPQVSYIFGFLKKNEKNWLVNCSSKFLLFQGTFIFLLFIFFYYFYLLYFFRFHSYMKNFSTSSFPRSGTYKGQSLK